MSLSVIIAVLVACIALSEPILFKARLTEAQLSSIGGKYELIERLAMSGDLEEVHAVAGVKGAGYEDFLSGQRTTKLQATAPTAVAGPGTSLLDRDAARKAQEAKQAARANAAESGGQVRLQYVTSSRIVGNAIVLAGSAGGRAYELAFRPAFPDDDSPFAYIWLCGRRAAPEGWLTVPPVATATTLPAAFLPSPCRKEGRR